MYSKNKGITGRDYIMTPPPGYDGSRFRHRSDGRDDAFLQHSRPLQIPEKSRVPVCEECTECCHTEKEESDFCESGDNQTICEECLPDEKEKKKTGFLSFFQSIGSEELLLIALILLLAKDDKAGIETVLILALLLCIT